MEEIAQPDDATGDQPGVPPCSDGSPGELAELVSVLRTMDRLAARALALAAQIDGRRAVADEGMPLDTALQLHTGWTRTDVRMLLTATDLLTRLPAAARLFGAGVLSWGHIRLLVTGARRFDAATLTRLDGYLDTHADRLAALEPEQRSWALDDAIDEHTATATLAARADRQPDHDRLVLSPRLDGSGSGFFDLHAEAFDTVARRLAAEADTPRAAPAPLTDDSDPPPATPNPPSRSRQLADALVRLCAHAAAGSPLPPARSTIIIDTDRLTDRFAGELRPALATRPPRIVRRAIDRVTCDSDLDVVLRHGTDLLAAKRYRPEVSTATRRALAARDGGCRFPGCRAPVSWCDVHHIHEQARNGDHALTNLVLLCRRHHTVIHRRGWRQTLYPDGRYRISRNHRTWTTLPRHDQQLPPPHPATTRASPTREPPPADPTAPF